MAERRRSRFPGFHDLTDLDSLVAQLVQRRIELRLTQTVVAARMCTSQSAVARLEAGGADVRVSTLERYAAALGQVVGWRLDDAPGPPRPRSRDGRKELP